MAWRCTDGVHCEYMRPGNPGCDRGVPTRYTVIDGFVTFRSHLWNIANDPIQYFAKKLWGNYE